MMKRTLLLMMTIVLIAFALLTLFLSSSVIFDLFGIRAKEGNYVLFVVWANLLSSILYLVAAIGLLAMKRWSYLLLAAAGVILMLAFIGLVIHINMGGIYEKKTVVAMVFRIAVTIGFANFAYFFVNKSKRVLPLR